MGKYAVVMEKDGTTKYYFIRNTETFGMELLPSKYLAHKIRSNRSPNTVRRSAFAICYYLEYVDEKQMELSEVYGLDYEAQYDYFLGFLNWLKHGNHKEKTEKCPNNGTCNAYLKDVFRFYLFLELTDSRFGQLSVLSSSLITMQNAAGVKKTLRFKAFKGYLKEEERKVRAAEKTEIMAILEACTNCRDQLLILLTSELGYRIGEILGIDYTKDIDYANHQIRVDFRDDNENDARAKNAEERDGKVSEDTFEFLLYYLSEYWDLLQHQDYLFINIKGKTQGKPMKADSVYDMFERMEKKTQIKVTPHMLRRYFANTRWEAGWPLELISRALGHKHLDTTTRYLKIIDDRMKTASREFYDRYSSLYGVNKLLDGR
ncbi:MULTISPECIES: tyrosine-type recombinase/integrase [Clostridia]|uniref:tyrosine-type recombinase/integrase n=1 Tax=Clostridia TaxID=186801 RepID=UPI00067EA554|nr:MULTISPECIES: tyrosine-type recombinase/integrase [Clostridia]